MYPQAGIPFLTAALVLSFTSIHAIARIVLVDDQNSVINYSPRSSWNMVPGPGFDEGGTHMVTTDPTATATITCSFINAHFWSSKWPYQITTAITVDGNTTYLDLQDYSSPVTDGGNATIPSNVVYTYSGSVNQVLTIVVSMAPVGIYTILDMFTFDVDDWSVVLPSTAASSIVVVPSAATTPSTSPSSSTPATAASMSVFPTMEIDPSGTALPSEPLPTASLQRSKSLQVVVGAAGATTALAVSALVLLLCHRRTRGCTSRKASSAEADLPYPLPLNDPYPVYTTLRASRQRAPSTQHTMSETHLLAPKLSYQPINRSQENTRDSLSISSLDEDMSLPNPHSYSSPSSMLHATNSCQSSFDKVIYPSDKKGSPPTVLEWDPYSRYKPTASYKVTAAPRTKAVVSASSGPSVPRKSTSIYDNAELLKATRISKLPGRSFRRSPPPYRMAEEGLMRQTGWNI